MKYMLVNKYGNRVIETDSEKKKNQLLEKGFHIYKTEQKAEKNTTVKRRKAAKKDAGKTED